MNIIGGAVAGTLVAAFIAWLWSRYGHRVNLARFFQVTAVFLLVFVVQLLIYGFHELAEANIFPNSQPWHDATEPYGPDGVYGQYLTYLLVAPAAGVARGLQPVRAQLSALTDGLIPGRPDRPGSPARQHRLRNRHRARICPWRIDPAKPPTVVELVWEHDLVFGGTSGDVKMMLDSAAVAGRRPCRRWPSRSPAAWRWTSCTSCEGTPRPARAEGATDRQRAQEMPHAFTAVDLHFTVTGDVPDDQVQRAIDLSHDKYCSVWHSMRQDIELDVTFKVGRSDGAV